MPKTQAFRNVALVALLTAAVYIVADNVMYSLKSERRTVFSFEARHEANGKWRHRVPESYASISEATLFRDDVDFRTGEWGNILPNGGEGKKKVVFFGGSTTESHWMPEDQRWPFLIGQDDRLRSRVTTYNFGVGGQNLHHSLIKYLMLVGQIHPDVVVVNHQANDLGKLMNGGYYALEGSDLYNSYTTKESGLGFWGRVRKMAELAIPFTESMWRNFSNRNTQRGTEKPPGKVERLDPTRIHFDEYFARLKALRDFAQGEGARLALIVQPNRAKELLADASRPSPSKTQLETLLASKGLTADEYLGLLDRFTGQLREFARKEEIFLVDAQAEFPHDEANFYDSIHFSPAGSVRFAEYLVEKLEPFVVAD